ncbi:N-acetyl sugar amidotransferase [Carboxylicivirga sp. N1Y90]|uniref:N-acetyl sugar amidotransferase n=1 Tax=Carboxylicivirga fragile TaxID=3417571 RepID=UPI003D337961|nr:N-acetyl sugar amidotransferase [Marinilabiliaceae bacterium N1Y90]
MNIIKDSIYHPGLLLGRPYQMCTKTVMDTTDPNISFDAAGVSNHYHDYQRAAQNNLLPEPQRSEKLHQLVEKIKKDGQGKKYDCLIGLSGGVDSTYVALLVKQYGLRPLAVHLDNGWNSELAVHNVNNIVNTLDFDLHTLVVNWEEFKDIQLAYLKASVIDIEVVSDHAIQATMWKLAKERNIGYIISGTNIVTEHILPSSWIYSKMDYANLRDIHQKYGSKKIKTYPTLNFKKYVYYTGFHKLVPISILDYVDYNKEEVKATITKELNWRDYGGKHHESVFTKFYQAFILPQKFGVDKRKAHLSTLICSGQITREDALKELQTPLYNDNELADDMQYVLKKFRLSEAEFDSIMRTPPRPHQSFKSDRDLKANYMKLLKKTERLRRIIR